MIRRPIVLLAVVSLVVTACTFGASPGTTITAASGGALGGRLVVLDDQGDVVTLDPDGSNRVELTTDGASSQYFQPIWSPNERRIAWSVADEEGFAVVTSAEDGSDMSRVDTSGFPFYLNWSPDGEQIGILHGGSGGGTLDFELVDADEGTTSVIDQGSPYYFSWSPGSDAVVVHVNGDRLEIFDESANPLDIGPTSPNYLSPRWTPDGIFYLGPDGVMLRRNDNETELVAAASGFVSINPNRDGSFVAVHTISANEGITVSAAPLAQNSQDGVVVVDTSTGEESEVVSALSVGSFWSPDGTRLMVLAVSEEAVVDFHIWEAGETRRLTTMELSVALLSEALAFFDQYAQSWNVWSPDSDAIVFPGSIDGSGGVWVVPLDGSGPRNVSDGRWAAWSHG